jgi:hypothetical protein
MTGYPEYEALITSSPGSWIHSTLILIGDTLYYVEHNTPESSYKANLPIVEDFIKSIKITPR